MNVRKFLTVLFSALMLLAFSATLSGCCCGDTEEFEKELTKELNKEFEADKKERATQTPKKTIKPPKKTVKPPAGKTSANGSQKGAVAKMTPKSIQEKVEGLGWKVLGKPTQINPKSVTLSVIKGTTGGAVSLNEFDIEIATDAFVKTMEKNDGAVLVRSGNKVVSVVMPGKRDEAKKVLGSILGGAKKVKKIKKIKKTK